MGKMFVMPFLSRLLILALVMAAMANSTGCKKPEPPTPESRRQELKQLQEQLNKER
jgi:hypothetical protein